MAKFRKYQEVIYEAAGEKYKGTVEDVHELTGRSGPYHKYDVKLTHKQGVETTTNSPTKRSTTQDWEDITPKTEENVAEHNLKSA